MAAGLLAILAAGSAADDEAFARRARMDAELCALGTGVVDIDILVCSRAIRSGLHDAPNLATLHTSRGRALRLKSRFSNAMADHRAALVANPISASAFHERALTLVEQTHFEQAEEDLGRALALFPGFAEAWRARGRVAFLRGDDGAAVSHLDRALELQPENAEAHAFRAFSRYRRGEMARAERDLSRARERHLNYPYTSFWLYLARAHQGIHDATVLEREAERLDAHEWPRALVEALLGREDESAVLDAVARMPAAVREARTVAALFHLGARAGLVGEVGRATDYLKRVLDLAPRQTIEHQLAGAELGRLR